MIQILLVEDNFHERKRVINILKEITYEINIYEAETGKKAIEILRNQDIDLFFLDIELPDISGIELAEKIRQIDRYEFSYIVFITSHVYFQLKAFKKIHCYDFIEKPYEKKDILEVTEKLIRAIKKEVKNNKTERKKIKFKLKSFILSIYEDEIIFIESQGRNCLIHTQNEVYEINNLSMKKVLNMLSKDLFMQTHKSYIINVEYIKEIKKKGRNAWTVYFYNYKIPAYISNKYKNKFINVIDRKEVNNNEVV
ncbi:LytR/AlgR family response regulator transcription factor [Defluviitalea phaphyphila]|uniref:LytR/AlgR family response regulator transcription factor n=1 Tax=Defluviitalea phaphyphila TaxID=1473580 RepID=UPI000730ECE5|nr:LytTR family DNA-binding domain-containing protein [Defluviitalea phaphyphila]